MGNHKNNTISFRVSEYQRNEIESKIKASGMKKQDYFVRSCIYNKVCVVGKKETIIPLIEELQCFDKEIKEVVKQLNNNECNISADGLNELKNDCIDLLKSIMWLLEGAQYMWQEKENNGRKECKVTTD